MRQTVVAVVLALAAGVAAQTLTPAQQRRLFESLAESPTPPPPPPPGCASTDVFCQLFGILLLSSPDQHAQYVVALSARKANRQAQRAAVDAAAAARKLALDDEILDYDAIAAVLGVTLTTGTSTSTTTTATTSTGLLPTTLIPTTSLTLPT